MKIWVDNDTFSFMEQDNGNAFALYFAMPRKVLLIQALNHPTDIEGYTITGALAIWESYFGVSNTKAALNQHDANPNVDHSGAAASPRG